MSTVRERETSGRHVLIWVLWAGLGFAVAGESLLFWLADGGSTAGAGLAGSHLLVSATFASLATIGAGLVYAFAPFGEGLPTALVTWMLLKSVAITGLISHQLGGRLAVVLPFFAVFVVGMAIANPTAFQTS